MKLLKRREQIPLKHDAGLGAVKALCQYFCNMKFMATIIFVHFNYQQIFRRVCSKVAIETFFLSDMNTI